MQRTVWVLPYIPNPYRPARGLVSAVAADGRKWSKKTHDFEEVYRGKKAKPYVITFGS